MQPRLRQVPPNTPCSTIAMRQPDSSGVTRALPEPEPTTTRSKSDTAGTIGGSGLLLMGRERGAGGVQHLVDLGGGRRLDRFAGAGLQRPLDRAGRRPLDRPAGALALRPPD